jgi:hypothetical protein
VRQRGGIRHLNCSGVAEEIVGYRESVVKRRVVLDRLRCNHQDGLGVVLTLMMVPEVEWVAKVVTLDVTSKSVLGENGSVVTQVKSIVDLIMRPDTVMMLVKRDARTSNKC